MDVVGALRAYLDRLLSEQTGMKALLLDSFTSKVVSLVYSQHELLQKEVFLTDLLENEKRRPKPFLKAVVIARPTEANLRHLKRELRDPLFASFSVYWTSSCSDQHLHTLAELDTHDRVTAVHEYYLDYFALDSVSFSAGAPAAASTCLNIPQVNWGEAEAAAFDRCIDSIVAVLLATKSALPCIRYAGSSNLAKRLADSLQARVVSEHKRSAGGTGIFGGGQGRCLVLIMDRRQDPVTPLLSQWTYQAMVHELFGIRLNRVDARQVEAFRSSGLGEITLNSLDDLFLRANRRKNYGDTCIAIKEHMEKYQQSHGNVPAALASMEDMQNFVDNFPQFKKQSHSVNKHVALISACKDAVDALDLFAVSKVEQNVSCAPEDRLHHFESVLGAVKTLLHSLDANASAPAVKAASEAAMRLALLYILRYPTDQAGISQLEQFLGTVRIGSFEGLPRLQLRLLRMIRSYAKAFLISSGRAKSDTATNAFKKVKAIAGRAKIGITGVKNVYTQHRPLVEQVIKLARASRLVPEEFPVARGTAEELRWCGVNKGPRPTALLVFFVGGFTYEEIGIAQDLSDAAVAAAAAPPTGAEAAMDSSASDPDTVPVVLGGSCVLNSSDYLVALSKLEQRVSGDAY